MRAHACLSGRPGNMSCPGLRNRQNRRVDLAVPHDCKDDSCHLLGHVTNDIHVAQALRRFLFVISLEHGIKLYRSRVWKKA